MIDHILEWGRANVNGKKAIDIAGHFDREQTDELRKELRRRYKAGERHVDGSWRCGYELVLPTGEAVGVTNGHAAHFVIYYRKGALYYG